MTRSRLLGLGLGVVASSALVVSPLPAAAEEVPAAAAYTVTGYGYGHGHGLSQYGAQGAANQGLSWKQIIGFYYPGTRLGRGARHPQGAHHRGQEGRHGRRPRRASAHAADRAQDLHPGQGAAEGDALADHAAGLEERGLLPRSRPRRLAEVDDVPGCRGVLGRQPAAALSGCRGTGPRSTAARCARSRSTRSTCCRSTATCRASSHARSRRSGRPQAVRAQAVAARTYAAFERETATSYYDICDTESCQVYGGVADEHPASNAAVKATARQGRALPGPAGLHPVLLEQRRLQLGRLAALPGRPARSLRSVLGQPQRPVDRHRHARTDREGVARGRQRLPTCRSAGTASAPTSAAGSPR